MKYRFSIEAEEELDVAYADCEAYRQGMGTEFQSAITKAIDLLLQFPHLGGREDNTKIRRFLIAGYPYSLIYKVQPEFIDIIALPHHKQRPGYWKKRLKRQA